MPYSVARVSFAAGSTDPSNFTLKQKIKMKIKLISKFRNALTEEYNQVSTFSKLDLGGQSFTALTFCPSVPLRPGIPATP